MAQRALVIGGGVSGLTTAHVLLEAGWEVTLRARAWAPQIVSSVAAAIWHPYQVEHPQALGWSLRSAARFRELMAQPASGVRAIESWQLHEEPDPEPPPWADYLTDFRHLTTAELPEGYLAGFAYEIPLIETPRYMPWLKQAVVERGAVLEQGEVASLDALVGQWPLIVNCTGLAARELVGDETMYPIRGQLLRLEPGLETRFLFNDADERYPIYLIPRADATLVGGTAQAGDWDLAIRPSESERLLAAAQTLTPALAGAKLLEVLVGLRPGRPTVRLEAESQAGSLVIHNYGHGGSGYTLSWGCAEAVLSLSQRTE